MKLVDEIIDAAIGDETAIAVVLRKCMVLGRTLSNKRLARWAEKELNDMEKTISFPSIA